MANHGQTGWELLSYIAQTGSLKEALARRITAEMFGTPRQQRVFEFIERHHQKYQKVPSPKLLHRKFPRAKLDYDASEPASYYIDAVMRQYLRAHGSDLLMQAAQNIGDDPFRVFEQLTAEARAMLGRSAVTDDVVHTQTWRDRLAAYRKRSQGEMLGIPAPWESWNSMSFGFQPEDFIIITARPGVGKTFFLLWIALTAAYVHGKKVLFFTKEMSINAMQRRADAMWFKLPYNAFRKGMLSDEQYKQWKRAMRKLARAQQAGTTGSITFVSDGAMSTSTIEAKIEEHGPDLVCIDGLYLVTDLKGTGDQTQRVANVSRETRALAQVYKVPIVATSQIHRMPGNLEKNWRSLTSGDLAFSDALTQDAETIIALIRTEEMRKLNVLMARTLKQREDEPRDWGVSWNLNDMDQTFHEVALMEEGSINEQIDRDADGQVLDDSGDDVIAEAGGFGLDDDGSTATRTKKKKKRKKKHIGYKS